MQYQRGNVACSDAGFGDRDVELTAQTALLEEVRGYSRQRPNSV